VAVHSEEQREIRRFLTAGERFGGLPASLDRWRRGARPPAQPRDGRVGE